jgi:hypothetical protein
MKIDYSAGGFFKIDHIKWGNGQMFLDMQILIPDGAAELQNKLTEIKKSGLLWIPLNDIKMHLNGVGRII